jgi:short-subunit dehydrogenase
MGYFDALRAEVSQFNISVLNVCPGPVQTDIAARAIKTADAAAPVEVTYIQIFTLYL